MDAGANLDVSIRWLIRRDMLPVLEIERDSFSNPWTAGDFLDCLRQRNCVGMVAEDSHGEVVGFMVYTLHDHRFDLVNMAVDPNLRRLNIGRQMVQRLKDKLTQTHKPRTSIRAEVRETNLVAQQFLREMGFRLLRVERNHYDDTGEDCYILAWRVADPVKCGGYVPKNRFSQYIE